MRITTHAELLALLDDLVARGPRGDRTAPASAPFWTDLLTREGHPLATPLPDECLLDWHARGLLGDLRGARVLDVGCGGGRNARWFGEQGADVVGIDLAGPLLDAARPTMPPTVTLQVCDVLRDDLPDGPFDLVHDSGCYHHLAPHRRPTYRERVLPLAARWSVVAFAADAMQQPDDADVLLTGDQAGGMAFTDDDLRRAAEPLVPVEIRRVRPSTAAGFGEPFLTAGLFARQ